MYAEFCWYVGVPLQLALGWDEGIMKTTRGYIFKATALPLVIDDQGGVKLVGRYEPGAAVFADDNLVFQYLLSLTKRDLQFRGVRDDRLRCFALKQNAFFVVSEGEVLP